MSDRGSTTLLDTVAPGATTPSVRQNRRRKKGEPGKSLADFFSYFSAKEESDESQGFFEQGVTVTALLAYLHYWLKTAVATGYGISLLVHGVILLSLSLYIFSDIKFDDMIQSAISTSDQESVFDEIADVTMDVPEGDVALDSSLESAMDMETADWAESPVMASVENSIESLFDQEGDKGLGGGGFLAPQNARVFTKGSFSAWTIPNDPRPGQDYVIVIVLKLPNRIKRYRASDLSGMVIGTDRYRQPIPGPAYNRGKVYLPMKDKMVQLKITVPGARSKVRDVIEVRSGMLKEKQKIQIEF